MTADRLRSEGAISLSEASGVVWEVTGRKPAKSTLIRWVLRGSSGKRLAALRVGGTYFTTRQAVDDFIESCCASGRPASEATPARMIQQINAAESRWAAEAGCRRVSTAKDRLRQFGLRLLIV